MTAGIALALWPVVTLLLFRLSAPAIALSVALIGGYLFLPERTGLNLPLIPELNKFTIPALAALCAALALQKRDDALSGWLPKSWVVLGLLAFFIFGEFGTALTNSDTVFSGYSRPGLSLYDGAARALSGLMAIIPFLLARRFLSSETALGQFLTVLVFAAVGYGVLALYEVRMSPQLNNTIYGFFPHSWLQHIRGDGFRPLVFLEHGLRLALFLAMGIVAAVGLIRIRKTLFAVAAAWLLLALVLAKSLGALIITCAIAPVALLLNRRGQLLVAACVAGAILLYPPLRSAGLVPIDPLMRVAESIDASRAQSFRTRVESEAVLLERAQERPVFGWGGYGRERAYDDRGRERSISDGFWIITLGQSGWVGYIGQMGLFCWPLLVLGIARRRAPALAGVAALVMAANLIDLVPNSGVTPLTWMLAGALVGLLERMRAGQTDIETTVTDPTGSQGRALSRSFEAPRPAGGSPPPDREAPVYRRDLGHSKHRRAT